MPNKDLTSANSATIHGTDLEGSFAAGLSAFESVFDAMSEQEKNKLISLLQNTVEDIINERQPKEHGGLEKSSPEKNPA